MARLDILVPVRFADLDAYGHVNNAAFLTLLEDARIAAFWTPTVRQQELGAGAYPTALPMFGPGADLQTVIGSLRVEYRRPLDFAREGVTVRLWLSRLGGASLTVDYLVLGRDDPDGADPYALARTTVVVVDARTGAPARIDDSSRETLAAWQDTALSFRD